MKHPLISIIIPTYFGSVGIVEDVLKSIMKQTCQRGVYEVILADNLGEGSGYINDLSKKYHTKKIEVEGKPPRTCYQVNAAAKVAKGKYIFIVDHDVELSPNLLINFLEKVRLKPEIDAWYVPYKIIAKGVILNSVRNFEELFYKNSVVAAARIIKRDIFWKTKKQYDSDLTTGPADWDLTNQLKMIDAKFDYIDDYVFHHEEQMSLWQFLTKKTQYADGGEIYKKKWKKLDSTIYKEVVQKQYSAFYRLFLIFVEKENWKKLLPQLHMYILFLLLKITVAGIYFYKLTIK